MEMELTKEDLREAMRARQVANLRYRAVLRRARDEGWTNSEIARTVGVSEAAIRLYWVRNPESKNLHTADKVAS
jgi:DNA-directed RNA polymerase specialized sigma24 family protein